jgi:hypothetical protein
MDDDCGTSIVLRMIQKYNNIIQENVHSSRFYDICCSLCLHDVLLPPQKHLLCLEAKMSIPLICGHFFHTFCLCDWIQTNGKIVCPICFGNINSR